MFLSLYELWDHDSPECQHGPTDITVASPGYLGKYQKTIIIHFLHSHHPRNLESTPRTSLPWRTTSLQVNIFWTKLCLLTPPWSPDPGRPLDGRDLWYASQLRPSQMNETTVRMMKRPQWRLDQSDMSLEELELIGEQTKRENARNTKLALAHVRWALSSVGRACSDCPLSYHWPHGILYYNIDAAFSTSERAVIASGFAHVEENSCIRWCAHYSLECPLFARFLEFGVLPQKIMVIGMI